jgi:hypothetical protein
MDEACGAQAEDRMITRRSVSSMLAGLPIVGAAIGTRLDRPPHPPPLMPALRQAASECVQAPISPLMPHHQAARLAMQVPHLRDLMTGTVYRNQRNITHIDPDIDAHCSWSHAAKITFQRQRNVAIEIENYCRETEHEWLTPLRDFVNKLVWGKSDA